MNSPLDIFAIVRLIEVPLLPIITNWTYSITNHTMYLIISSSVLFFIISIGVGSRHSIHSFNGAILVPSRLSIVGESIYASILNMSRLVAGNQVYMPLLLSIFGIIMMSNLISNIPYNYASTSAITFSLGLSLTVFIGVTLIGISLKKSVYLAHFVPSGAPSILLPLLVIIELISYCARAVSLGVRLFANITAGHCLLNIISSMTCKIFNTTACFANAGLIVGIIAVAIPTALLVSLVGLEVAVALIQAYVFAVLTSIYTQEASN